MNRIRQSITLLGSTGSIGLSTLRVVDLHPDLFQIRAIAAATNHASVLAQIQKYKPQHVYIHDKLAAEELKKNLPKNVELFTESEGILAFTQRANSDILVAASSGTASAQSVIEALNNSKKVALANKEVLVAAGTLVMNALKNSPAGKLIPIDSEHSAIYQCLEGHPRHFVQKLILTSSGGPLWNTPQEQFPSLDTETVINHPRWKMGKKISVDSATLMNKGLEVIEAMHLFGLGLEKIHVVVHPQAFIHSMVEFIDGSILSQMGVTDMAIPIAYALAHPRRIEMPAPYHVDFSRPVEPLTFSVANFDKFPCLRLAYDAARSGGTAPAVLSMADEVCVEHFLGKRISFDRIPDILERTLSRHKLVENPKLCDIECAHSWARQEVNSLCLVR